MIELIMSNYQTQPPKQCSICGATLPADAPFGHCPHCLLALPVSPSGRGITELRVIGDYELLGQLGRGGMGVVYRARQRSLNRIVAVKMLLDSALSSPTMVRRFEMEAETVARLDHPHVVPIYEVREEDGQRYFSMKLIEGDSLAEQIARKQFTPKPSGRAHERTASMLAQERIARLMMIIAQAVHYAHREGVLHRDLKPGNILIDGAGEPHLTDFGLAKTDNDGSYTDAGTMLGTASYMAPELAAGGRATVATDIYSLGVIFYELLTGRPPFRGTTPVETLRRVVDEEAAHPKTINLHTNRDLGVICMKALEKDPLRRYASAGELADDLGRWLRHEPVRARRAGPGLRMQRWVRRNPAGAVLIVALTLGLGGALGLLQRVNTEKIAKTRALQGENEAKGKAERALARTVGMLKENLDGLWGRAEKIFLPIESEALHTLAGRELKPVPGAQSVRRLQFAAQVHENPVNEALRFEPLLAHLEETLPERLGQPVRFDLRLYKPGLGMWEDIASGQVDFSRIGALVYLRGRQASQRVTALVQQKNPGKQGAFFARKNSGFSSPADLRGRSLALGDTNATISMLALWMLVTNGLTARDLASYDFIDSNEEFLRDVKTRGFTRAIEQVGFLHSHGEAIESVIAGRHDAGVAQPKFVYAHRDSLEIIPGTLFESTRNPWVIHTDLPPDIIVALRDAMMSMKRFGWLEEIPDKPEGFVPVQDSDYEPLGKALEDVDRAFPLPAGKP